MEASLFDPGSDLRPFPMMDVQLGEVMVLKFCLM